MCGSDDGSDDNVDDVCNSHRSKVELVPFVDKGQVHFLRGLLRHIIDVSWAGAGDTGGTLFECVCMLAVYAHNHQMRTRTHCDSANTHSPLVGSFPE